MTSDLRTRPLLVVLLLVVAAAGAGLLALQRVRNPSDSTSSTTAPATTSKAHAARPKATAAAHATQSRPKPKPKPKARPKPNPVALSDQLPGAIRRALAADRVVVVALYDPKAKIEGTAMREAEAGAQRAGSSFVPIDVRKNGVESLNRRYGVLHDPAVLVLRPPGSLVVRIDGFADRETVAQAALNAAT